MVSSNCFRALAVAVAVWGAVVSGAQAAVITGVSPVAGGATVSDTVDVALSGSGITFGGGATGLASGGTLLAPVVGLLTTGSLTMSGSTLDGGSFSTLDLFGAFSFNPDFLSGTFVEAASDTGVVEVLFSVSSGAASSAFGPNVLLSLFDAAFDSTTVSGLSLLPSVVNVSSVSMTIAEVEVTQQSVPAPASLPLMLGGLGVLAVAGRRREPAA